MTETVTTLAAAPAFDKPWQATINGLHVGPGTPYGWTSREGIEELPGFRMDATPRPNAHGTFDSAMWAEGRTLTFEFRILRETRWLYGVSYEDAIAAYRRTMVPSPGLVPVWINVPGRGPIRWDVRITRHRIVTDPAYDIALAVVATQVYAPDPLGYGPEQSAEVAFPELVGGLEFDLFTDGVTDTGSLEFGERGETGRARLTNEGNAESYPLFHVAGPALDGFELVAVGPGRRIRWEGRLYAGDLLTVDPARGTALLNGTADRSGLFTRREWFAVPPGEELEVQFLPVGTSVGATATIVSASAWW
ncbi:phage distal tail protein [Cellulosimicrobium funkei]|uniref:phage distal tail protein n=1 Tax=Cellulosimicrobium funkei TaxID=264251 RepID=UPI003419C59D